MATIEELEQTAPKVKEGEFTDPLEGEEVDELNQDMLDALSLLSKSMHLLDYLGDTDLCKTITKKERASMTGLADMLKAYLDSVESYYVGEDR